MKWVKSLQPTDSILCFTDLSTSPNGSPNYIDFELKPNKQMVRQCKQVVHSNMHIYHCLFWVSYYLSTI